MITMSTPAQLSSQAQLAEQYALNRAQQQAAIRAAMIAVVVQQWLAAPRTNVRDLLLWWWGEARDRIFTSTAMGQEMMAMESARYIEDSLTLQGYDVDVPVVAASRFAAVASDGRDLDTLLDQAMWRAWASVEEDRETMPVALAHGEFTLRKIVHTQLSDAGREADQVAIVGTEVFGTITEEESEAFIPTAPIRAPRQTAPARTFDQDFLDANAIEDPWARRNKEQALKEAKRQEPTPIGWIRMLTPPSCGRCAILAGRWYGWNDGFQRHPNCNCVHIPAPEAVGGELSVDPQSYFDSLSKDEQDRLFGAAVAEAIRDGADIAQAVNAVSRRNGVYLAGERQYTREGTTRRGFFGQTEAGQARERRPTPLQIYKDAAGDREEAKRLLRRFGYISD